MENIIYIGDIHLRYVLYIMLQHYMVKQIPHLYIYIYISGDYRKINYIYLYI